MQDETPFFATDDNTSQLFRDAGYRREQAEAYYRWWYDWSKYTVENDRDLSASYSELFENYPVEHHQTPYRERTVEFWALQTDTLGKFIAEILLPRLDEYGQFALQMGFRKLLADIDSMRQHATEESSEALCF